jgi:hypothetical protein
LRSLFEEFRKNHNLILIGRPSLLADLICDHNSDRDSYAAG